MNGATVDTTESLLAAFAEALRADDAASATIRGYVADVRRFALWYERRLNASLSEPYAAPDLAAWRSEMQDAGMAPAAINRVLAALRRFAAWREGAHQTPPLGRVRAVRVETRGSAPQSLDRLADLAIARALQRPDFGRRDQALYGLLRHCGLRVGEAVAVRISDVHLGPRSGHVRVRRGKGNKERTVPANVTARGYLSPWLEAAREEGARDEDWLFPTRRGRRGRADFVWAPAASHLSTRTVELFLEQLSVAAKVECAPHRLRHTFAKALFDAGVAAERVAAILGHESLDTTAIYTKATAEDLAAAAAKVAWE